MHDSPAPTSPPSLLRIVAGLLLDYVRWTQLVPMVMAWAFLLLMVGAMLLVNFQQQSFGLIDRAISAYERVAGPIDRGEAGAPAAPDTATPAPGGSASASERMEQDQDGVTFTDADIKPLVLKAWALLALAGWVLGMAWRLLFGRVPRPGLKRKLQIAGLAGLACTGLFLFAYFFGSERFNGPFAGWLALFIGIPLAVWFVSAYSLAVSTLVDRLERALFRRDDDPSPA